MLVFLSETAGFRVFLFTNESERKQKFKTATAETTVNFRNIPINEETVISLIAENINQNEYDYLSSMGGSNVVKRVRLDGSLEPVQIVSFDDTTQSRDKEFDLELKVRLQQPDIMTL